MIKLYQYEISPFCDKVRRVLRLKRQAFETQEVTLWQAGTGFLKGLNPAGKVPVLEHDGERVCDSTPIVAYLEEVFPEPAVLPKDPRQRAEVHVLDDWAGTSLYFFEMYLRFKLRHNVGRWVKELSASDGFLLRSLAPMAVPRHTAQRLEGQGLGNLPLETVLGYLDGHLSSLRDWLGDRQWLVGETVSLADISVFVQLFCMVQVEEGQRAMQPYSTLREWYARVERVSS